MYDVVVKNGLVISAAGRAYADVGVDGEQIAAIGLRLQGKRVIDASGCLVIPGGVDPHVHLQMPLAGRVSTDTFASGTTAAICGGTTTVIDFVTPEPGQSMLEAFRLRRSEADGEVAADYGLHMTVPAWHAQTEDRLAEIPQVVEGGCVTFKMYQAYAGMELNDIALLRAMRAVAAAHGGVVLHSEVGPVIDVLRQQALQEGHTEPIWHARTRPARLEVTAVHRAIVLASLANAPLYIFHVGAQEVADAIRQARHAGLNVRAETCPQYLLLTAEEHLAALNGELYICAPPLRSEPDQKALWRALADDTLSVVSTDHCPWLRSEKAQPDFAAVPGGVPSIESRLSLIYHFGVRSGRLSLERWVDVCSAAPARLMGLTAKGRIAPGYDADLVVFDPAATRQITVNTLHEAADWTPYEGLPVTGWPRTVLLRGGVAVDHAERVGPVRGRYVTRTLD